MLSGESQFHVSIPLGIEPGSFMTGSKGLTHRTSETVCECSEIAGSPQGSPQQPTMLVVKPEGGLTASMKPGQKSCVSSIGIITLSAQRPSDRHDGLVMVRDEACLRWDHKINHVRVTNVARNAIRRIPVSQKYPPGDWTQVPHDGKQRVDPLDQWDCVWMQWDCRLSTMSSIFSVAVCLPAK
jgi:hypothetical protein